MVVAAFLSSGFRVQGSGFRVQGLGFRVSGLGFWVLGLGLGLHGPFMLGLKRDPLYLLYIPKQTKGSYFRILLVTGTWLVR